MKDEKPVEKQKPKVLKVPPLCEVIVDGITYRAGDTVPEKAQQQIDEQLKKLK